VETRESFLTTETLVFLLVEFHVLALNEIAEAFG
jgi:hypothetical protein